MKPKRIIKAKELVLDLRSGISFEHLMDKYQVSQNKLCHLLSQLFHAGAVETHELEPLLSGLQDNPVIQRRDSPRRYVFVPLPIFDLANLLNQGAMTEISRNGFQVSRIPAASGATNEFLVQPDYFVDVYPFVLEAQCVWSSNSTENNMRAGFKITSISDEALGELEKIINMLTIGKQFHAEERAQ